MKEVVENIRASGHVRHFIITNIIEKSYITGVAFLKGNQFMPLCCPLFEVCPHNRESVQGGSTVLA